MAAQRREAQQATNDGFEERLNSLEGQLAHVRREGEKWTKTRCFVFENCKSLEKLWQQEVLAPDGRGHWAVKQELGNALEEELAGLLKLPDPLPAVDPAVDDDWPANRVKILQKARDLVEHLKYMDIIEYIQEMKKKERDGTQTRLEGVFVLKLEPEEGREIKWALRGGLSDALREAKGLKTRNTISEGSWNIKPDALMEVAVEPPPVGDGPGAAAGQAEEARAAAAPPGGAAAPAAAVPAPVANAAPLSKSLLIYPDKTPSEREKGKAKGKGKGGVKGKGGGKGKDGKQAGKGGKGRGGRGGKGKK